MEYFRNRVRVSNAGSARRVRRERATMDILFADDDDIVAEMLTEAFRLFGYSAQRACSADEAWRLFGQRSYRAVLTNNMMPGMLGVDFAALVKSVAPKQPVVMLSAVPPSAAHRICDSVMSKPIRIRDLITTLRRLDIHPSNRE